MAKAHDASFASLLANIQYLDPHGLETVRLAYRWADELHLGQMRHSGDPYITHPLAVTKLCAEWQLDAQALCAALLHDTLEDCGIAKRDVTERFGSTVADLVDGLTKLEKLPVTTREENQAESFRKMLLAMATDVRVILIKLADRTHNMRTLGDSPPEKWMRIAGETQEIYAPIAHRLGLNQTYRELQDLSFKYLKPWRYQTLTIATSKARARAKDLLARGQKDLETAFAKSKLKVQISGREKTLFSIYRKMRTKHVNFSDISDLFGFRIVVANLFDCYTALGVLHQLYKPVPGRFKDHIAIPKANGYQSLHTTLIGPSGVTVEFQIRTEPMHWIAESGVAAHWLYKAKNQAADATSAAQLSQNIGAQWLQSLLDIQNETVDASEFWDHVKVDLFPDAVYVFTPKNKIMALPRGATVVDFAYAVHSTIGDRCMSAKINGELAPLRSELKNGDRIEIITAPVSQPNPAWLSFVRTGRARSKIRHYMKTQAQTESLAMGQKLLTAALRLEGYPALPEASDALWHKVLRFTGNKSVDELLVDLGLGKRMAIVVAKRLAKLLTQSDLVPDPLLLSTSLLLSADATAQSQLIVDGIESASMAMATCCHPIAKDAIVGYLGHGEGLIIHRETCPIAGRLMRKDADRMMAAVWADDILRSFVVPIQIDAADGQGVLAQITSALAAADANIVHIDMTQEPTTGIADLRFRIAVQDSDHLTQVLASLARVKSVLKVQRI